MLSRHLLQSMKKTSSKFLLIINWHKKCINPKTKCSLHSNSFLTHALNNPRIFRFYTPIAHMIERIPSYRSWGDASISAAGGYSSNLHFWWFLQWPKSITDFTIDKFMIPSHDKNGTLISINILEFVAIIINFIVADAKLILLRNTLPPHLLKKLEQFPTLLNYSDNTTFLSWTPKACSNSPAGR